MPRPPNGVNPVNILDPLRPPGVPHDQPRHSAPAVLATRRILRRLCVPRLLGAEEVAPEVKGRDALPVKVVVARELERRARSDEVQRRRGDPGVVGRDGGRGAGDAALDGPLGDVEGDRRGVRRFFCEVEAGG